MTDRLSPYIPDRFEKRFRGDTRRSLEQTVRVFNDFMENCALQLERSAEELKIELQPHDASSVLMGLMNSQVGPLLADTNGQTIFIVSQDLQIEGSRGWLVGDAIASESSLVGWYDAPHTFDSSFVNDKSGQLFVSAYGANPKVVGPPFHKVNLNERIGALIKGKEFRTLASIGMKRWVGQYRQSKNSSLDIATPAISLTESGISIRMNRGLHM